MQLTDTQRKNIFFMRVLAIVDSDVSHPLAHPLPNCCSCWPRRESLERKEGDTHFRTTGTAAWPWKMCLWTARHAVRDWATRHPALAGLLTDGVKKPLKGDFDKQEKLLSGCAEWPAPLTKQWSLLMGRGAADGKGGV